MAFNIYFIIISNAYSSLTQLVIISRNNWVDYITRVLLLRLMM